MNKYHQQNSRKEGLHHHLMVINDNNVNFREETPKQKHQTKIASKDTVHPQASGSRRLLKQVLSRLKMPYRIFKKHEEIFTGDVEIDIFVLGKNNLTMRINIGFPSIITQKKHTLKHEILQNNHWRL